MNIKLYQTLLLKKISLIVHALSRTNAHTQKHCMAIEVSLTKILFTEGNSGPDSFLDCSYFLVNLKHG